MEQLRVPGARLSKYVQGFNNFRSVLSCVTNSEQIDNNYPFISWSYHVCPSFWSWLTAAATFKIWSPNLLDHEHLSLALRGNWITGSEGADFDCSFNIAVKWSTFCILARFSSSDLAFWNRKIKSNTHSKLLLIGLLIVNWPRNMLLARPWEDATSG